MAKDAAPKPDPQIEPQPFQAGGYALVDGLWVLVGEDEV
jgi:hypothetical protein